jgi:hypothetical protein
VERRHSSSSSHRRGGAGCRHRGEQRAGRNVGAAGSGVSTQQALDGPYVRLRFRSREGHDCKHLEQLGEGDAVKGTVTW